MSNPNDGWCHGKIHIKNFSINCKNLNSSTNFKIKDFEFKNNDFICLFKKIARWFEIIIIYLYFYNLKTNFILG